MQILMSLAGMTLILLIAFVLSSDRKAIRPRVVLSAFALQAGLAALVLYVPFGNQALQGAANGVSNLLGYANEGTKFLFGALATDPLGQSFAIGALPVIIFFASLISILYYLGIMQYVIRWIGGGLQKITGISKVESLCAASNIFVGQSESPLVIRPYLAGLNPAQLFCVMTIGMAGVAGTILAAYASMGIRIDYLIAAAFMSAPGGILMAKMIMPDDPNVPVNDDPAIALDMHGDDQKPTTLSWPHRRVHRQV
jgi:concentrative nucleoside transporter, CNT family